MSVIRRLSSPVIPVALAALLAACGDDVKPGTLIAPPSTTTGVVATSGAPGPAPSAAATQEPSILFIANTGGTGVALRSRCEDSARSGGTGFRDGTEARVVTLGGDQCAGWTLVDAGGTTSWVRNDYLSTERPAVTSAPPPASAPVPPSSGGGALPAPPPQRVRIEKVLLYGEHLIPVSQLEYRSAAFGPILMTPTGPKPGSYICPVYNYSAPAVRTVGGVILQDPDPMGCGFARADTAVIRDTIITE